MENEKKGKGRAAGAAQREQEIAQLRDMTGESFKLIAERYGISPSRAAQIYQQAKRRQRETCRQEFYQQENQKTITFEMTLGEAAVLDRILLSFRSWKLEKMRGAFFDDLDCAAAEELEHRLRKLERQNRSPRGE